ncbi:MAG TPA: cupredoxin domain-containing protein [Myxococcales bacterium]|jgi:cytochrome c oxidase subunit 2|nr:cupredoxin domain-containing protein [Myxococcales bacterium]
MIAFILAALLAAPAQDKVIQVTAERFKFTPGIIHLKAGEPVVLEITSLDRKHGFSVPDLNIDENVEAGKVTRVRIVPAKAGTFDFHCSVFCGGGHEEMAGQIVVDP